MTPTWKTPGVYIVEKDAFPNSVVEVTTSVPAFIGYTETHDVEGRSLQYVPRVVRSIADFHAVFGFGPPDEYTLAVDRGDPLPVRTSRHFHLYRSLCLFYRNGGRRCVVVPVGDYGAAPNAAELLRGIEALEKELEPTLVVMPDAVLLERDDCRTVQVAALNHCGRMRSRLAILDIHRGWLPRAAPDPVEDFRTGLVGVEHLGFGAAYYPWLETTLVERSHLGIRNFDQAGRTALRALLEDEGCIPADLFGRDDDTIDRALSTLSPLFQSLIETIQADLNRLPPSGAIAGIYTAVDEGRGVWTAPANVGLKAVVRPSVDLSHADQEDLNVDPRGLSVNAIRTFPGEGTLVWGARTLDGNGDDGRYVNVRRTLIMLEQSIRLAAKAYVFEPNDAGTWTTLKSMIENFLAGIWTRGGLAGASPEEAFRVQVGLGETMTPDDVRDGILRATVMVAVTHPAEFVVITFEQRMQAS